MSLESTVEENEDQRNLFCRIIEGNPLYRNIINGIHYCANGAISEDEEKPTCFNSCSYVDLTSVEGRRICRYEK